MISNSTAILLTQGSQLAKLQLVHARFLLLYIGLLPSNPAVLLKQFPQCNLNTVPTNPNTNPISSYISESLPYHGTESLRHDNIPRCRNNNERTRCNAPFGQATNLPVTIPNTNTYLTSQIESAATSSNHRFPCIFLTIHARSLTGCCFNFKYVALITYDCAHAIITTFRYHRSIHSTCSSIIRVVTLIQPLDMLV